MTKTTKKDETENEAVEDAPAKPAEKPNDEVVKQHDVGNSVKESDPAAGPVPRNADPYADQRAAGAGNFEKPKDE